MKPVLCILLLASLMKVLATSRLWAEEVDMTKPKDIGLTSVAEWLPGDCATMMFVRPPEGRLRNFNHLAGKEGVNTFIQMPLDVLSGLRVQSSKHFESKNIQAIAAGALDFRMVKHGPVGITVCRGCVIVVFADDLELSGKDYLSELEQNGGTRVDVERIAVVKTKGRLLNESEGELFVAHPIGSALVFASDLDLMKQALARIQKNPERKPPTGERAWYHKYVDPRASFTAVVRFREKPEGPDQIRHVVTWRSENPTIVDVAWLVMFEKEQKLPANYAEEIAKEWQLQDGPLVVKATVTKSDEEVVWLRLDLEEEKWGLGLILIRCRLGFVATF